VLAIPEREQR